MSRFLVFLLIGSVTAWSFASEPTLVYLIRHAEKVDESRDPDLSDIGHQRAEALAAFLQHVQVDSLFCTQYKRTRQTLAPLAKAKALDIVAHDAGKPDETVQAIRDRAGQTLVIAGHSNTVPNLIRLLGGGQTEIDHDDYNNLYLLVITDGHVSLQRFHFQL